MALTRDNARKYDVSDLSSVTAATSIYEGSAVGVNKATGLAISGAFDSVLHRFAGFAKTSAQSGVRVTLQPKGRIILTVSGATDASANQIVYASDDDTFNLSGVGISVGRVAWHQGNSVCVVEFDATIDMDGGFLRDASGNATSMVVPYGAGTTNWVGSQTYAISASAATSPVSTLGLGEGFITMDSNANIVLPTIASGGYCRQKITIKQSSLGGWIPTFPANVAWEAGVNPQPPLKPNDFADYEFYSPNGGVNWYGARITATLAPLAFDRFTRADSATTLGSAEVGGAWSALTGTWGISGNKAYLPTRVGDSVAILETGSATHSIFADVVFGTSLSQPGLVGRALDINNFFVIVPSQPQASPQQVVLWKRVAGTYTQMVIFNLPTTQYVPGQSTRFGLTFSGNTISVYVNGVLSITTTDAALNTNTKAGIRLNDVTVGNSWDNLVAF